MIQSITQLRKISLSQLVQQARKIGIDNAGNLKHGELLFEYIKQKMAKSGEQTLEGGGLLEILPDGFGFLRSPLSNFAPGADDIYISPSQIRRFNLRTGDWLEGNVRCPRDGERFLAMLQIHAINTRKPEQERHRLLWKNLSSTNVLDAGDDESKKDTWFCKEGANDVFQNILGSFQLGSMVSIYLDGHQRADIYHRLLDITSNLEGEVVFLSLEVPQNDLSYIKAKSEVGFVDGLGVGCSRNMQLIELAMHRCCRLAEQGRDVYWVIDDIDILYRNIRGHYEQQDKKGASSLAIQYILSLLDCARFSEEAGSVQIMMVQKPLLGSASGRYRSVITLHCTGFLFQSSLLLQRQKGNSIEQESKSSGSKEMVSKDTFVLVGKENLYKYTDFL